MKYLWLGVTAAALTAGGQAAAADYSAAWQAQIGDTATVQTQSKGGAGITIAIVDTGLAASNPEVAGRVSSLSSCAAVTFTCASGFNDDNGHGTSVASIAAGRFSATAPVSMSGVAPAATILSEKVLNASGAGYDTDIANGITKAANGGAQVINLSLTYVPTTAVINAVNYATSKGAVIVWAGGNSNAMLNNGVNTNGLTSASLTHLILVGSVGATNAISSFSNRPGTGLARTTNGTSASYASLWIMANGENIVAPAVQYGAGSYAYWTGTSMAAPETAGAVALLEATWPILRTNGTAASVLFVTAKDLGAAGVDSTYGNGLLNLSQAFQPIGSLSVIGANGQTILVSNLTGTMITSGALGPLTQIQSQLSAYTAFDTYQRNFTVDLSGLLSSSTTPTSGGTGGGGGKTPKSKTGFVGGLYAEVLAQPEASFADGVFEDNGADHALDRLYGARDRSVTGMTLVDARGDIASVGHGVAPAFGFAQALLGPTADGAEPLSRLGASSALLNLAQGGYSSAVGASLGGRLRVAAAWSQTDQRFGTGSAADRTRSTGHASSFGVAAAVTRRWTAAVSVASLREENGLLGATYDGEGLLSFGREHESRSVSISSAYDLGGGRQVIAEAAWARASGSPGGQGLVRDVSDLAARAWGVSFVQASAFAGGDRVTLTLRQPLRVTSGVASLAVTTVDEDGYPHTAFAPVSLAPAGRETDVELGYQRNLGPDVSTGAQLAVRRDAQNVRGQTDVALRFALGARF